MKRWFWLTWMAALGSLPAFSQTLFAPRVDYGNITGAIASVVADFNNDGLPDIAVLGSNSVYVLLQNASPRGGFSVGAVVSTGGTNTAIAAGNFHEHGNQDLLIASNIGVNHSLILFAGNGNGTFGAGQTVGTTGGASAIAVGRFNLLIDQHLDFVEDGGIILLFSGDGTGHFPTTTSLGLLNAEGLAVGDFNKDGRPDLLFNSRVFLGDGRSGFTQSASPNATGFPVIADFDHDQRLDAALVGNGTAAVFLGNGDGTFQTAQTTAIPNPTGAGSGDFNSDGKPDLAIATSGNPGALNIYLGQGTGAFQPPITLQSCVSGASSTNTITVADLDGNGVPDVIVSCNSGNTVSIFLGLTPSVTLVSSANPSTPGQSVTLTAWAGALQQGVLYTAGFNVQFFDGSMPLGLPTPLANGQATLTTSQLAQGIHYLRAVLLNPATAATVATSGSVAQVVSPATCAQNVSGQLQIAPGGFRRNPATGQFTQTVAVTNASQTAIVGPLSLALSSLPTGVMALNTGGVTSCTPPAGAPLVDAGLCPGGALAPGQSTSLTLTFSDPQNKAITYTPVALAGFAPR